MLVGIAQDSSKAYPGGEIGRVMSESRAKDLLGLREQIALPQLLGQRKEKAGLRIGFHPKPQFLDLWVIRRHGIKTLPQKRTAPEGAVRNQVQCFNRQRDVPTNRNVLTPALVVIVSVHVTVPGVVEPRKITLTGSDSH